MRFKYTAAFILAALVSVLVLFVYGRYIEPNTIHITRVKKTNNAFVSSALKGKKIAHLSDLHLSTFGPAEEDLLKTLDRINPDLIFLTGDYIPWNKDNAPALTFLSRLKAPYGVFAVMGDYDYSDSKNACLFCHEKGSGMPTKKHSVVMLRNSSQEIRINDQLIRVAGIDEGYDDDGDAFMKTLGKFDPDTPLLVLSHSPLAFDTTAENSRVFMFSGDTHGGQIKLPSWLFKLFGYQKNVQYNYGLFQNKDNTLYVTRGIGTSHFKFRLFCPPEIAVIEF